MNEFEVLLVHDDLQKKGYDHYDIRSGNNCIWASVWRGGFCLDLYYIFREGRIVDIQVD